MFSGLLLQIALIIIIIRCIFVLSRIFKTRQWLEILFQLSIIVVAISYYAEHFGRFF